MTIAQEITNKLDTHPSFIDRRFREKYLLEMVLAKNVSGMFITADQLPNIIKDYTSYERIWRDILQDNEELRGADWNDGKALSQKYQIEELGREVGYREDVKRQKTLTT
jgi:hypothetical protein